MAKETIYEIVVNGKVKSTCGNATSAEREVEMYIASGCIANYRVKEYDR